MSTYPRKPRAKPHPLTLGRETGLSSVEYAIIAVIIAAIAVGAWKTFGENVEGSERATEARDTEVAKPKP